MQRSENQTPIFLKVLWGPGLMNTSEIRDGDSRGCRPQATPPGRSQTHWKVLVALVKCDLACCPGRCESMELDYKIRDLIGRSASQGPTTAPAGPTPSRGSSCSLTVSKHLLPAVSMRLPPSRASPSRRVGTVPKSLLVKVLPCWQRGQSCFTTLQRKPSPG